MQKSIPVIHLVFCIELPKTAFLECMYYANGWEQVSVWSSMVSVGVVLNGCTKLWIQLQEINWETSGVFFFPTMIQVVWWFIMQLYWLCHYLPLVTSIGRFYERCWHIFCWKHYLTGYFILFFMVCGLYVSGSYPCLLNSVWWKMMMDGNTSFLTVQV